MMVAKRLAVVLVALVLLAGCASVQTSWNNLSTDEKARIVVGDLQTQLSNAFDTGKAYVTANPSKQAEWKAKVIPAFDVANKALASAATLAKEGKTTPDAVYAQVQPLLNAVIAALKSMSALK
jgi:hypothetical protein